MRPQTYPFLGQARSAILERRLAKNLPTLGICLGAQLMAKALGGRVFAGPVKEVGWGQVDLTADRPKVIALLPLAEDGAKVVHWHGDTFDLAGGRDPARRRTRITKIRPLPSAARRSRCNFIWRPMPTCWKNGTSATRKT